MGGGGSWNPLKALEEEANEAYNAVTNAAKSGAGVFKDASGEFVHTVTAPVSKINPKVASAIQGGVEEAGKVRSNIINAGSKALQQTSRAAFEPDQVVRDIGKEAERQKKDADKLTKSLGKETTDIYNVERRRTGGAIKGAEKVVSGVARGDLKRAASGALQLEDANKQTNLDRFKKQSQSGLDLLKNTSRAIGYKDGEVAADNARKESDKGQDIYGPLAYDIGADIVSKGQFSATKTALQNMSEDGVRGLANRDVAEEIAIQYIASKYNIKPQYLRAANTASKGDYEGSVYAGAGVDSDTAKALRQAITEGRDLADSLKERLADELSKKYGIDKDAVKMTLNGKISKSISSLAKSEIDKRLPGQSRQMLNLLDNSMSIKDIKKLAANSAGDYLGISPSTMQMAGKVIKNPRGEALQALAQKYNIDPTAYQNIRDLTTGDLKAGALQAIGNSIGLPLSELQIKSNLNTEDLRGIPLQALADNLGIPAQYLQMGQQLLGKPEFEKTIGEFDEIPIEETRERVEKQTNNLEETNTGKKMSEIVGEKPETLRQFFWRR